SISLHVLQAQAGHLGDAALGHGNAVAATGQTCGVEHGHHQEAGPDQGAKTTIPASPSLETYSFPSAPIAALGGSGNPWRGAVNWYCHRMRPAGLTARSSPSPPRT